MNPKVRAAFGVGSQLARIFGLRTKLREARANKDTLALVDAIILGISLVTGTALAIRELRKAGKEE